LVRLFRILLTSLREIQLWSGMAFNNQKVAANWTSTEELYFVDHQLPPNEYFQILDSLSSFSNDHWQLQLKTATRIFFSSFVFLFSWELHYILSNCSGLSLEVRLGLSEDMRRSSNGSQVVIIFYHLNIFEQIHFPYAWPSSRSSSSINNSLGSWPALKSLTLQIVTRVTARNYKSGQVNSLFRGLSFNAYSCQDKIKTHQPCIESPHDLVSVYF
jgi:hypothetical protein